MKSRLIAEANLEVSVGGLTLISLELYAYCSIKSGVNGMRGARVVELLIVDPQGLRMAVELVPRQACQGFKEGVWEMYK